MTPRIVYFTFIPALTGLLCCSCGKSNSGAPIPLPEEQIPSVVAQAFSNSDQETQAQVNQYISDVKNHDIPAAFEGIQKLFQRTGLTPEQRAVLARALMTTSQKIQDAAANGDEHASQALSTYSGSK